MPKKKDYYSDKQEQAIITYIREDIPKHKKDKLFEDYLYDELWTMVQSIIRKYPIYIGDCGIEELEYRTLAHLLENMDKYYPFIVQYRTKGTANQNNEDPKKDNFRNHKFFRFYTIEDAEKKVKLLTNQKSIKKHEILKNYLKDIVSKLVIEHNDDGNIINNGLDKLYGELSDGERNVLEKNKHLITLRRDKNNKEFYYICEHDEIEYDIFHSKSYSYLGTICRNYLKTHSKKTYKVESTEDNIVDVTSKLEDDINYQYSIDNSLEELTYEELFDKIIVKIKSEIKENFKLKENDVRVGEALILILENWERLSEISDDDENNDNTNFFTKKKIYQILKDITSLETKDITESLKHFKSTYFLVKDGDEYY